MLSRYPPFAIATQGLAAAEAGRRERSRGVIRATLAGTDLHGMTRVEIDWGSAEVHEGELVVGLTDEAPGSWRRRFDAVRPQLERGGKRWDAVVAKKRRIVVTGVEEGGEDDVRLLLESLVREANANEPDPSEEAQGDPADERMTAAFRSFGPDDGNGGA
jgi:hypothetical protein